MSIPRNSPCICGSGKKYKHCCLGKTQPKDRRKRNLVVSIISVAILLLAGFLTYQYGAQKGIIIGVAGFVLLGVYFLFKNPPPSRGRKGADHIGFGN